jgi:hypothetical protein
MIVGILLTDVALIRGIGTDVINYQQAGKRVHGREEDRALTLIRVNCFQGLRIVPEVED